ncbi:MAG: PIN domain-containing protein [Actinobacteria bacterium]|nr:PIN domain-containing protein [Actinomycetota bacterium]
MTNHNNFNLEPIRDEDIIRVIEILKKYDSLDIGYVDASIVAIAERLRLNKILTLSSRI